MKKDELRHDPVKENIIKFIDYMKNNQSLVFKLLFAVIILVSLLSYYNSINSVKLDNAAKIAGTAQSIFIDGREDEAIIKFNRVLNDYPGTAGALQSLVYLLKYSIANNDLEKISSLIIDNETTINSVNDPLISAYIFKVKGDVMLYENDIDNALLNYKKAEKEAKGTSLENKYKINVVSAMIKKNQYSKAKLMLENILDDKDIGYNDKNKAEELLGFLKQKLNT